MKSFFVFSFLFTCVFFKTEAQVNYVKNPDFESFSRCPISADQIIFADNWSGIDTNWVPKFGIDSFGSSFCTPEYCNACGTFGVPEGPSYWQIAHSGKAYAHVQTFYDESGSPPTPPYEPYYRDYLQGRLYKKLTLGKSYCVTFFVSLAEASNYALNNIGAYLNDGHLDTINECGRVHSFVTPQVYTTSIVADTFNWVKIEGTFTAVGNEKYITIGNFFKKSATSFVPFGVSGLHYSWYLIDDVSVIETNLPADAGPDQWVPVGDSVFIGRGLDSTKGLDCKWYHKGVFVDSGAGIFVHATTVGSVDTYSVVQTICGLVRTDTVLVLTASVGIDEVHGYGQKLYELFPNPSKGQVTIRQTKAMYSQVSATICDLSGRRVFQGSLQFENGVASLLLPSLDKGVYVIQLHNPSGGISRMQIVID